MIHAKLNIIPLLLSGFIALTACNTAKGPFGQVDDDVYFSRKQSHTKDVYVPEVDVQEIIKANPPQYGTDAPQQRYDYNDNSSGNSNFNYDEYKAQQGQTQQNDYQDNNTFLNTVPYVGQEEEAAEASRLRMQYSGDYNTYNTYNNYNDPGYGYNNGYNNYYNNWYTPSVNIGFNSWGGWGVGLGWGWSSGWGNGWPHYNPYWGGAYGYYNPWAWNGWYTPYYGNGWGYNSWCGPYGGNGYYPGNWGYNQYAERATPRTSRPRQSAGSALPRGENTQPRGAGMTGQAPATPNQGRAMPRNPQQGQLINRDGQQIYVAPQENRTPPRTYNSYDRSVRNGQNQRDVTPAPQQPVTPRTNRTPPPQPNQNYRGGNNGQNQQPQRLQPTMPQRNYSPAPAPSQPAQRNYTPAPSAPSSPGTISPPAGGGGRGSSGSSGSGGGGRTMPRR